MRPAKVWVVGTVLAVLVTSFPTWGDAQSCCLLPQAAVQSRREGGKQSSALQAAEPAPAERGTLEAMVSWCTQMMHRCASAMGIEASSATTTEKGATATPSQPGELSEKP